MKLKEKLSQNLKDAIKNKLTVQLSTLRLVIAAMENARIAKKKELTEDDIVSIIQKEVKKREDAIEAYQKGGRAELAQKEKEEMEILQAYLPEQLSDEELEQIIKEVIKETDAQSAKDLGKVMGPVMAKVRGRSDGKKVNEKVRQLLA